MAPNITATEVLRTEIAEWRAQLERKEQALSLLESDANNNENLVGGTHVNSTAHGTTHVIDIANHRFERMQLRDAAGEILATSGPMEIPVLCHRLQLGGAKLGQVDRQERNLRICLTSNPSMFHVNGNTVSWIQQNVQQPTRTRTRNRTTVRSRRRRVA